MDPQALYPSPHQGPSIFISTSSSAPYTTPSLTANLFCRVLFGLLSNLVCLVPLGLLHRNGEFAAVVFILNIEVQNLRTVVNALFWRDDDLQSWWPGYGLCDVDVVVRNAGIGLYSTCLLAIMRNLALQVGNLRAHPLTQKEKRRRNLVQALIILPLPLVQMALTYPLAAQRFLVGTLVGCTWNPYPAWPYLVFHVLGPPVVGLITAVYAVITYLRFREVAKTTESALSTNRVASMRSQRTKRRLYLMVLSILTPFLPVIMAIAVGNILFMGPLRPFDYSAIRQSDEAGVPWNSIILVPSDDIKFVYLNNCYIPIISAIPIFVFFGMTKDAMNCYRVMLLYLGLGKAFPSLYEEYDPDRRGRHGSGSYNSSSHATQIGSSRKKLNSSFASSNQLSSFASSSTGSSSHHHHHHHPQQPLTFPLSVESEIRAPAASGLQRPLPARPAFHSHDDTPIQLPHRNPFLFRTRLNFPIPAFSLSLFRSKKADDNSSNFFPSPLPLEPLPLQPPMPKPQQQEVQYWDDTAHPELLCRSQTACSSTWFDEESTLFPNPPTAPSPVLKYKSQGGSYDSGCCGITVEQARLHNMAPTRTTMTATTTTTSQADGQQH